MTTIVQFPRPYRHPLPADAEPYRDRHVDVFPCRHCGRWGYFMCDDGGGAFNCGLSRMEALEAVAQWCFGDGNATLSVLDHDPNWVDEAREGGAS